MLTRGEQIDPDVVHHRRVARAVDRRVNERGGAAPVFVFRIRVEDLRQQLGRSGVREQAVGDTRLRVALRDVGERKDVGRIEEVEIRVAVPRRLREAVIEAAAAGARHLCDHAVEHLAVAFVLVEAVVEVRAKKSAALRNAERQRTVYRAGRNRQRAGRRVLQHRDHVADRCRPQPHERRVLRGVDHLVDLVRLELRRHVDACRHPPPCRRRRPAQSPTGFSARCGAPLPPSRARSSRCQAIPGRRPRRRRDRDRPANDPLPFR